MLGDRFRLAAIVATLSVTDNGAGLAPNGAARSGHHGLRWMAERAEGLGGQLTIEAADPRGARLRVSLPLARTAETPNE